ncbi:carboxyltransferase domain-containing protein [Nocardioides sp. TF02-7]|uniref:5-oxoprolinase subunit B family protein n=1 Tax=Nocardioides sp. TF02-7 TaxID=2917724 RepID=UPI001F05BAD6|nr:carboxyltransferase domain-containing protein [Nocardioides sp. TF02-7]UMG94882.1 allophanate hydrolase subunit 1 [Nocardioides sp. TF02-7]
MVDLADLVRSDTGLADLVEDVVPGARTLLVRAAPGVPLGRLRDRLADTSPPAATGSTGSTGDDLREQVPTAEVEVPVTYDGPDLAEVARHTGLREDEVVAAHTGTPWRVAFGGFAPGFAYLVGGDPRLRVPRRDRPRTTVPAGAVGLAGEFSGVYPRPSPGGWQLIGRTDLPVWDLDLDPPALLAPGATVRFRAA